MADNADHAPLRTGWEPDTPPSDTLLRAFVVSFEDWIVDTATAMGAPVHRDDDVLAMDPGSPVFFLNGALARHPLDAATIPALVETVQRFFRERPGGPFLVMSAWPTPDLAPFGFELVGHPPFMFRPVGSPAPPPPQELEIVEVHDGATLEAYERTLVEAYPLPAGDSLPGGVAPPAVLKIPGWRMWVGFVDGRAVATSAAHVVHGVNRVEWVSTRDEVRGRGYGEAITWAATVADPRLPAMLIASDLGRPTYVRMGFLTLTRFTLWLGSRA
jgi:hypothetical protein